MKNPIRWTILLTGAALLLFVLSARHPVTAAADAKGKSLAPTGELRDIKGPLPPDRLFPFLLPGGVAIILSGMIMALVIMRRRSRRVNPLPTTAPLSPEAALDLLESRLRDRPEDIGILYLELSRLLRILLEQRTGLPVPRMTTEEFLAEAAVRDDTPPEQADRLRVVLLRCDLVKFAGDRPSAPETEATLEVARSLIPGGGRSRP